LSEEHVLRLVRAYGTRVERVLGPARHLEDLGPCVGADLTAAEVRYLMEREWAQTEDDGLWRRTKLGFRFSSETRRRLGKCVGAEGRRPRMTEAVASGRRYDTSIDRRRPSVVVRGHAAARERACPIIFSQSTRVRPRRGPSCSMPR